jgi:hypothetical protein
MSICLAPARAAASRRNGAKSKGPKTPEGKARSAQNALKHGLRALKHVVLPGEDAAEFEALEAAIVGELAPEGALQSALAQRVVAATWRLERAERIEAELFAHEMHGLFGDADLGLALIRDCNGARAFDTLLRYRGGTLAELWRALRTLKALQAERAMTLPTVEANPVRLLAPQEDALHAPDREAGATRLRRNPIEPDARANPGESTASDKPEAAPMAMGAEADELDGSSSTARPASSNHRLPLGAWAGEQPSEPEARGNPRAVVAPAPHRPPTPRHAPARGAVPGLVRPTDVLPDGSL